MVAALLSAGITYLSLLALCRAPPLKEHRQQSWRNTQQCVILFYIPILNTLSHLSLAVWMCDVLLYIIYSLNYSTELHGPISAI